MVRRNRIAGTPATSTKTIKPSVTQTVSGLAPLRPACYSTKSSSQFACSRSSTAPQTSVQRRPSGTFRSPSPPMTQTASTCKQPSSSKPTVYDHVHQSATPWKARTMYPDPGPNSFMVYDDLSNPTGFTGYGAEFGAYGSPENETDCGPLDFYPVPQSFQEAHSFSSSYWDPSDLPFVGPEYGGGLDEDAEGIPFASHLTDEASTDEQTPIHTPESATPAASVADGEKYGSMPYAALIYKALMEAPGHQMVLQDIYNWFRDNTDKVDPSNASKGWQNSIRHNLSMNEAFIKVDQDPSPDGKRSFSWALHPSVIGKGYVESTTRYRKSHSRRVSRGQGRQISNVAQTSVPAKPAPKRSARRLSVRIGTPPNLPRLAPSAAPRASTQPVPIAPRPATNTTPGNISMASTDHPDAAVTRAPTQAQQQAPVVKMELEAPHFTRYEHLYPTLMPSGGPLLHGYSLPGALYHGRTGFEPFAPALLGGRLGMDSDYPYAMAFDPATPEALAAPPFPPQPKYAGVGDPSDVAVVEYGESVFVPSRPSSLETMLLNHPNCQPGDHSVDCWQDICRY